MEVTLLKKLDANKTLGNNSSRALVGLTEDEITEYEKKLELSFPLAYKEFLFLTGKSTGYLLMYPGASELGALANESYRKTLEKQLKEYGVDLRNPIWVFTEADGFQQFLFFYLDGNDNPDVYSAILTDRKEINPLKVSFSEYVNDLVDESLLYQQRGY